MSEKLDGKTVVLGVTGSIAAYKAAEIAGSLVKLGVNVHIILTQSAARFITPLTMRTVSRNVVAADIWDSKDWKPGHIDLAKAADLLLVAPATAHKIAEFAQGLAPDLLTGTYLATKAPVLIAPAMNMNMLSHPATQANIALLRQRGVQFVDSKEGILACGDEGPGKLANVETIVEAAVKILTR